MAFFNKPFSLSLSFNIKLLTNIVTSQCIIFCNNFCQGSGFTHFACPFHSYRICLVRKVNVRPVSACNAHPHNHGKRGIITEYVLEIKDTVKLEKYITLSMCFLTVNLRVAVRSLLEAFFAFILLLNQVPA